MVAMSSTMPGGHRQLTHRLPRLDIGLLAEKRLHGSNYRALHTIRCSLQDDALILSGCLSSYFLKQMAQEAVVTLPGVVQVVNLIEVNPGVAS